MESILRRGIFLCIHCDGTAVASLAARSTPAQSFQSSDDPPNLQSNSELSSRFSAAGKSSIEVAEITLFAYNRPSTLSVLEES